MKADITGINVPETTWRPADEPAAEPMTSLSAAHLRAATRQQPGEDWPELVISDDEVEVTVEQEMGSVEQAILGYKRLGDAAYAHAHLLEQRHARGQVYS